MMKIRKSEIQLSTFHPSLLLNLPPQSIVMAPLVINQEAILIDGYRRYMICSASEVDVIQMSSSNIYETAMALNFRTRQWDETDCFLWARWAHAIKEEGGNEKKFAQDLFSIGQELLSALANRKLTFRQFLLIARSPRRYRPFFERLLTERIQLNSNETAKFLETSADLVKILGKSAVEDVFEEQSLRTILEEDRLNLRQKGEKLLKQMRILRYPYYTKELRDLTSYWDQLKLDPPIQTKNSLFLERGALEMSFSVTSLSELKETVSKLYESLESPVWKKIWEE